MSLLSLFKMKQLSIRQAVRLNTLFYSSFFLILILLSAIYLFNSQARRVDEEIEKHLQKGRTEVEIEIRQIKNNLQVLARATDLLEQVNPEAAAEAFSKISQEMLENSSVQFNAYFALEKEPAQKYFHHNGYIVTTHWNFQGSQDSKLPGKNADNRFLKETFTDQAYQTDEKEVWYHLGKLSDSVAFTKVYFDGTYMKRWMISASKGLYRNSQFYGMVGIDVPLDNLVKELDGITLGETGAFLLVDARTGQILNRLHGIPAQFIRVDEADYQPVLTSQRKKAWDELISNPSLNQKFRGENGKSYVVSAHQLKSPQWIVMTFQQESEAYRQVFIQIGILISIGLTSLLLLMLFSRNFSESINKPIEMLIRSLIRNIRSQRPEEITQVEVRPEDHQEIKRVSRLVNRLVKVVNRRMQKQHLLIEEQRIKATQAARMAALGQMAGSVAHEINSPLTTISLQAELLEREMSERKASGGELVRIRSIRSVIERINKIINGLRTLSRDGKSDPLADVPISSLVYGTFEICQQRFRVAGIELEVADIPPARTLCRAVQISQVLLNLLNNSFDAVINQDEKWVRMSFELTEKQILISVIDSGPAIPVENIGKIMQPFFTTKDVNQGTGLGLSISKRIVEDHGGELIYKGHSPNTRFDLILKRSVEFQVV